MRIPLSWLKDYVEITISPHDLARELTFAGLEVEAIEYIGLPKQKGKLLETKISGLEWDRETIVVGDILEVNPHPNADRLVLAQLDDGCQIHTVLTGAPNLLQYRGSGPLEEPIKVAYARAGAVIYDGRKSGQELMTLTPATIRGVESYSMACSEKELGISDEHDVVIILDDSAPVAGTPLADHIGDVVLDINITPNMARNANILGVAREVAALTGQVLCEPSYEAVMDGESIQGRVSINIAVPDLNPRFTVTLIQDVNIGPSPYWMQRRLRLAGMRSVSNIVDITNYVMLETGQPLHAFDFDELVKRAEGTPTITTRLPELGERLTTLDGVERELDDFTILVTDSSGALSIGGIMGGSESEVSDVTNNVLIEAASWNLINIRRSVQSQQLQSSEAGYRFSRGVHPSLAVRANLRAVEMMRVLSGGIVCQGVVDEYPVPNPAVEVELPVSEVERLLGITIPRAEIIRILESLDFHVEDRGKTLGITVPDHRLDIGTGIVGVSDLVEEIARVYGFERIPGTQISDTLPPQRGNSGVESEEHLRDLLVDIGLQEVVTYRLTSPEREQRTRMLYERPYVTLSNPIAPDRVVMRQSLLASVLEIAEYNARFHNRFALYEIGSVYLLDDSRALPVEPRQLAIVMSGPRDDISWTRGDVSPVNFYDLKGVIDAMLAGLHIGGVEYAPTHHPSFLSGRCASLGTNSKQKPILGICGELHPLVRESYKLPDLPVVAAEIDIEALLAAIPSRYSIRAIARYPVVVEDIALIVDEGLSAATIDDLIWQSGGKQLVGVHLFDIYRGVQVSDGSKSMAYRLTYQSDEKTLTDSDVAILRNRIVRRLGSEIGAELRERD